MLVLKEAPLFSGKVAYDIKEGTHWYQVFQWNSQNQSPGEASSDNTVGGVRIQVHNKVGHRRQERTFEPLGGIYGTLRLGLRY